LFTVQWAISGHFEIADSADESRILRLPFNQTAAVEKQTWWRKVNEQTIRWEKGPQ
jgi:hypothetical protein